MDKFSINRASSSQNLPDKTLLAAQKDRELKKSCDLFESLYYKKMLQIAFEDVNVMGEGTGNEIYKDMYLDELSKQTNGSLGLSKMLFEYLKNQQAGDKS